MASTPRTLRRRAVDAKAIARLVLRPLWEWVVRYAFLAGATALLLGIVANALLWQLGLPALFWHESMARRIFAGIGVGMFTVNSGVVGFLLASRRPWITELRAFWPEWDFKDYVLGLLVRYLLLTSAVLVAAVWLFTFRAPGYLHLRFLLPLSVTLGAAAAVGGLWGTWAFTESQVRRGTWLGRLLAALDEPRAERARTAPRAQVPTDPVHRAAVAFFIGQLLFFVAFGVLSATHAGRLLSAGLVFAMFMSALVSGYGAVRWWAEEEKFAWFTAIAGAWVVLAAVGPYRHTLLDLEDEYASPVPITVRAPSTSALLDSSATIAAWASDGQRKPLVVLAVDGGGIRAATWIVSMLTTLERDLPRFPYHVRVIAGASGGMVGAAYYVSTLQNGAGRAVHATLRDGPLTPDAMIDAVSADSLEASVRRLVFRDISPLVWHAYADRGYALEHQWELNTGSMDQTLEQLAAGEAEGWRPSLIFSPMIVEDGRRLLISNLDLGALTTAYAPPAAPPSAPASLSALELLKLVPNARNLHVSTVARMSASFPYVSPAAEVPTRPLRRVVDAGYYDEHGVALAAAWVLANQSSIRRYASKLVLIEIPDQDTRSKRLPNPCAPAWWSRGLSDFFSPPQGVLAGWTGAMSFRNDETLQALGQILNADGQDFFRSYVFEPYDQVRPPAALDRSSPAWDACARKYCDAVDAVRPVALSWHMISGHRELLRGASLKNRANCATRRDLVQWWTGADTTLDMLQGCHPPLPEPSPLCEG